MLFNLYFFTIIALFLYSFTQVDLSLVLSKFEPILSFQRFFQQIGFFQRPLSTVLYLIIILSLFAFYLYFLNAALKRELTREKVWQLILVTSVILTFSYNAFSYDLFNNIFDAKIVTYYNQNPYEHKALDYPGDPMLSFMHWTHRTYPYGPSWLSLSVPLSFIGSNIFIPTILLFKALSTASFLGTSYLIGKTLRRVSPNNELFGLVFFALNPLVLIEGLVSSHNDMVMMFFAIASFYLIIKRKYVFSFLAFLFSLGIKFATGFLFPVYAYLITKRNEKIDWEKIFIASVILMALAIFGATIRTNYQPWYLLNVLPFMALVSKKYFILLPGLIFSFFSLLNYVPFLYTGNWNPPIPTILFWLMISSIVLSAVLVGLRYAKDYRKS